MEEQIKELIKKYKHKEAASKIALEDTLSHYEEGFERSTLAISEDIISDLKALLPKD